jgi:hypothetical protein
MSSTDADQAPEPEHPPDALCPVTTGVEIPDHLKHRPTLGGMVVPYITGRRPEDRAWVFGAIDARRQQRCLVSRWCQICGKPIETPPYVFLVRPHEVLVLPDFDTFALRTVARTAEPALHPACVPYSVQACPMLSGRKQHYRSTPAPVGKYAVHGHDVDARLGYPAEEWLMVEATSYRVELAGGQGLMYAMVNQFGPAPKPLARSTANPRR